jgi:ankyrin repeat protein
VARRRCRHCTGLIARPALPLRLSRGIDLVHMRHAYYFVPFFSFVSWQLGMSPLHIACRNGHIEAVKALIARRANVQAETTVSSAERED